MNIDKLNMTDPADAMQVTYACIDRLQDYQPHQSLIAVAILFNEMAVMLNLTPDELLNKARRVTADLNTYYQPEIKALREYIKQEMIKK